jgi:hypothetical protein
LTALEKFRDGVAQKQDNTLLQDYLNELQPGFFDRRVFRHKAGIYGLPEEGRNDENTAPNSAATTITATVPAAPGLAALEESNLNLSPTSNFPSRDATIYGLRSRNTLLQNQVDVLSGKLEVSERKNRSLHTKFVVPAERERDEALKIAADAQSLVGTELQLKRELQKDKFELAQKAAELAMSNSKRTKAEAAVKEKAIYIHSGEKVTRSAGPPTLRRFELKASSSDTAIF